MRYYALIPAAGNGSRFRGDSPKQYWMLDGKPVLAHSIERLAAAIPLQQVHVAVAPGDRWFDEAIGERPGVTVLRCGGATRGETVCNLLSALVGAGDDDWILIHDAVRPCIDAASLMRLQQELLHDDVGGLLALPMVGTLKRAGAEGRSVRSEPREGLWCAQTPQMFRYRVLRDALTHPEAASCTDEAQAVEALGLKPRLVTGNPTNLKITYPDDLTLAAAIMSAQRNAQQA
ncbi:MAG: 2-C-methyl-D-erythritol 4-phosphate cytidylyltransferase [Casimicrobiaceae bacterium]